MATSALVTGGAGFIGRHLCARLVDAGYSVTVLDNLTPRVHPNGEPPVLPDGVVLRVMDVVADDAAWDALAAEVTPDVIIHLAADTATGRSLTEASVHANTNVVGAAKLLDALSRADLRPRHALLTSSRAVYGEGEWLASDGTSFNPAPRSPDDLSAARWDPVGPDGAAATPLPHRASTTRPQPSNVYGATKLAQEHLLLAWCTAMGVPLSVLRLQNVYGAGQSLDNPYTGVALLFARIARAGGEIDVYEDGAIVRDFVHVSDVVAAMMGALSHPPSSFDILDVGSGAPVTLLSLAQQLARRAGAPAPRVSGSYRLGDVRAASACIADTAVAIGWAPVVSLDDGVDELLAYAATVAAGQTRGVAL